MDLRTLEHVLLNFGDVESGMENWNSYYGIKNDTKCTLITEKFFNSGSEEALKVFMLGNIDGWKQIGALSIIPRHPEDSEWNDTFFESIRRNSNGVLYSSSPRDALWFCKELKEKLFGDIDDSYLQSSILLFELEIMGTAFSSVEGKGGRKAELSFLNIARKPRWSQFDAVLIIPREKLFVFFECKLTGDLNEGQGVKGHPYVNQMFRNLESAFLLTHHPDSVYRDWQFKYVLICPNKMDEYRQKYYSYAFDYIEETIRAYKRVIDNEYDKSSINKVYYDLFDRFEAEVPNRVLKIYWNELGNALQNKNSSFFQNYLDRLKEAKRSDSGSKEIGDIEAIEERLKNAGIVIN